MKALPISRIVTTTAMAWLLASAACAQQAPAGRSAADVAAEAVAAAHAPNQNVTRGSRGAETVNSVADPAKMYDEAVATSHAPNQNVTRGSRGPETVKPMADPSMVAMQAEAAAAAPDQNVVSGSRVNSKVISTMRNPVEMRAQAK